jgi:TonB-linked SusC/RagA family outer membrane protein
MRQILLLGVLAIMATQQSFAQQKNAEEAVKVTASKGNTLKNSENVSGVILDATSKKPLVGVNISVPSFSAAISDENGKFSIKVPSLDATLFISVEGMQFKQVALRGNKEVTIQLFEEGLASFYDNAAIPSGTKTQSEISSSVVSVKPQGAWTRNLETPDNFLQGVANGLNVIRKSGTNNVGASLFMRGINSLYATNKPLFVIDGMIYDNNDFGGSLISNHYNNPLSFIDIKDIDDISVIKDGSSLYGTKGANGVIMITTAKAKQQATKIDFATYFGMNFAPEKLPVMNAAEFRPYLIDVLQSQGLTTKQILEQPYMTDDVNNPEYYRYHNITDWQKEVFQNSMSQNNYLKITGGDNIAKYALSMGSMTNEGVLKNTGMSRYNMRFNADLNLSKKLTANTNLAFTYLEQNLQFQGTAPKLSPVYTALVKAPFMATNAISDQGVVSPNVAESDTLGVSNPTAIVRNLKAANKNYRFFGSLKFNYAFNSKLSVSSMFGLTNDHVRENFFIPRKGIINDTLQTAVADSRSGSQKKRLFAVFSDTRLNYNNTFGLLHNLNASLGLRYQTQAQEQDYGYGYNSATDELINVGYGVGSLRQVGGDIAKNRWMNTYFNANYSYNSKLFVTAEVAMDGSSRFGKEIPDAFTLNGNKYAVMPSIGAAWLLSSEGFMNNLPAISFLKLRAHFGLTGNDDIGNYSSRQYYVAQNLLGMQGLIRGNIANPGLQWEQNQKLNLGLDLGLMQDRLRASVDVYQNKTDKMLILEQAPTASGFSYMLTNTGGMETKGIEVSVNARIINHARLKWDVGASLATYKNTVTKLPDDRILTSYAGGSILTQTGKAANLFYGYKTQGVYSSDAEAANSNDSLRMADGSLLAVKGGNMRFVDVNGDNVIDENDRQVIGNPNPEFTGSLYTSVSWKSFTLDALFTFSRGNDVYNFMRRQIESGSSYNNQSTLLIDRWRTQGQVTDVPQAAYGDPLGNSRFSDRWIEDGSYLRLRTISLSYNVKIKPGFFKYITVYASANNLFTISNYHGYDPEFSSTESVFGQGVDVGLEPQYKSTQAGVRIGL